MKIRISGRRGLILPGSSILQGDREIPELFFGEKLFLILSPLLRSPLHSLLIPITFHHLLYLSDHLSTLFILISHILSLDHPPPFLDSDHLSTLPSPLITFHSLLSRINFHPLIYCSDHPSTLSYCDNFSTLYVCPLHSLCLLRLLFHPLLCSDHPHISLYLPSIFSFTLIRSRFY